MLFGDDTMAGQSRKHQDKRYLLTNNVGQSTKSQLTGHNNGSKLHCNDTYENCASLGQFYCTDIYKYNGSWSFQNCRQYCGWCGIVPTELGYPSTTANSSVRPHTCLYKGQSFKPGEFWQDGCQSNCTCNDEGVYECRPLCPTYINLPSVCKLVPVVGQCCGRMSCATTPPLIYYLTTRPNSCLYKGKRYFPDEEWQVGCEKSCKCKSDMGGVHSSCISLCLNWNNLPIFSICHLEPVPQGLCCQQLKCRSDVIINIPKAFKQQYPLTAAHNYTYV